MTKFYKESRKFWAGYRRTEDRREETELAFKMLRLPNHTTNQ